MRLDPSSWPGLQCHPKAGLGLRDGPPARLLAGDLGSSTRWPLPKAAWVTSQHGRQLPGASDPREDKVETTGRLPVVYTARPFCHILPATQRISAGGEGTAQGHRSQRPDPWRPSWRRAVLGSRTKMFSGRRWPYPPEVPCVQPARSWKANRAPCPAAGLQFYLSESPHVSPCLPRVDAQGQRHRLHLVGSQSSFGQDCWPRAESAPPPEASPLAPGVSA